MHPLTAAKPARATAPSPLTQQPVARVAAFAAWLALAAPGCAARPLARSTLRALDAHPGLRAAPAGDLSTLRVEVIPLRYGSARDIARMLLEVLGPLPAGSGQRRVHAVLADPHANAILLFGTEDAVRSVRAMLNTAIGDSAPPSDGARVTDVIFLQHADAGDVLAALRRSAGRDTDIAVDRATNALIVADTRANVQRLRALVSSMDTARR